jgi:hypothetical protein
MAGLHPEPSSRPLWGRSRPPHRWVCAKDDPMMPGRSRPMLTTLQQPSPVPTAHNGVPRHALAVGSSPEIRRSARLRRSARRPVRARRDRRGESDASADQRSEDRAPAAASSRSAGRTPTGLPACPCRVMLPRRCHHQDRLPPRCRTRSRDLTQIVATGWQHQQQLTIGRAVPTSRSPNSATTQRLRGLRRGPRPGARQLPLPP